MAIYDAQGNLLTEFDPSHGWLEPSTRVIHHEAVEAVAEVSHTEVLRAYPGGGRDLVTVIDVPGVEAREAWDEEVPIHIYHPYTEEELAARDRPSVEQRIAELEDALLELAALLTGGEA